MKTGFANKIFPQAGDIPNQENNADYLEVCARLTTWKKKIAGNERRKTDAVGLVIDMLWFLDEGVNYR